MSVAIITYCCKEKDPADGLLPAVERYLSPRIRVAEMVAKDLGVGFYILSGLYGLLDPGREIPDYDHLLTSLQVPEHAGVIEVQLREAGTGRVIFVTRTLDVDPGSGPYREAMATACRLARVDMEVLEIGPGQTDLAGLKERIHELIR